MDAEKAIAKLSHEGRVFDIIFLDPPYDSEFLIRVLEKLDSSGLFAQDGLVIAETDSAFESETDLQFLELTDIRRYGRTKFLFFKAARN